MDKEPFLEPSEEYTAEQALEIMDALFHAQFVILRPQAYEELKDFFDDLEQTRPEGQFALQMYFDDDLEDLANPATVSWISIIYGYTITSGVIEAEATRVVEQQPGIPDLSHHPEYGDLPVHVLHDRDADYEIVEAWRAGHPSCEPTDPS